MHLKRLSLSNFKCFEQVDIDLGKITVLTGANSSGKSSLLYGILGPLQSPEFPLQYSANGNYVNMGDFREVFHKEKADEDSRFDVGFSLYSDKDQHNIHFESKWRKSSRNNLPNLDRLYLDSPSLLMSLDFEGKYNVKLELKPGQQSFDPAKFEQIAWGLLSDLRGNEELDTTSRLGRVDVGTYRFSVKNLKELGPKINEQAGLGGQALFVYNFLETMQEFQAATNYISSFRHMPERTYYEKTESNLRVGKFGENYIDQIIRWEGEKAPEYKELISVMRQLELFEQIRSKRLSGGRFELQVKARKEGYLAPLSDVGFGISQFLPIIVGDLQLGPGSTLLAAQPEIHLHPSVQALIGNYMETQANQNNKRYIVETHSEYLLNRLRLLVVEEKLKPEDVKVYFLKNNGLRSQVFPIEFTPSGTIEGAPQDFFETYMMDVMDIALKAN